MACECIYIFKGDDTNWNNEQFLTFNVIGQGGVYLSTMTATFTLGDIVKENISLESGTFQISLSAEETSNLIEGSLFGSLQIFDEYGRVKTVCNTIPFYVTNKVIVEQNQEIEIDLPQGSPVTINLTVGSGGQGGGSWGSITGDIQNQTDLQDEFATKQDIISDLSTIRGGASAGATAVQPDTLETALATKQNALNETQLEAVNSGANLANIAQISTNTNSISGIEAKIPAQASSENQLADKDFVNSSIATSTANFIGTFESISALESYSGTITNNDYAFVINRVVTDNGNDWANVTDLNAYDKTLLTNFDYAWVINDSKFDLYRFDIVLQTWNLRAENIHKTDVSLNTAYNRYKATVDNAVTWAYEYTLNNSSFTASQWAAINSGATTTIIGQIATNTSNITSLQNNKLDVTTAASTYLSKADAASTYLTQASAASTYATQSALTTSLAGKQDTISDLSTIRSGAALGATSVQPADLATVATTGDYDDLLNKPSIPSPVTVDQTYNSSSTNPQSGTAVAGAVSPKQNKTLDTPIVVAGTTQTTVEGALGAINTLASQGGSVADEETIVSNQNDTISTVAVREQNADVAVKQWVGTKAEYDLIATKDEDTIYVVTDDNQGGLTQIDGYDANVPVQRLSNLYGVMKWQTKEVWYYNFNANNSLLANVTLPNSITSIDLIFEINTKLETHAQNLFVFYRPAISSGLFFAPSSGSYYQGHFGELGYYNTLTDTMNWLGDTIPNVNTKKWIRIKGTDSNQNIYTLDDDNYTIETLPALDSWTLRGTMAEQFSTYQVGFSSASQNYAGGTLLNYYLKANEQVVFDLRQGDNVTLTNNTAYLYNDIQEKEHWN